MRLRRTVGTLQLLGPLRAQSGIACQDSLDVLLLLGIEAAEARIWKEQGRRLLSVLRWGRHTRSGLRSISRSYVKQPGPAVRIDLSGR